jgi:peptidyl-prolyl cis-trans isomerase C
VIKRPFSTAVALSLALTVSGLATSMAVAQDSKVVATINGKPITDADLLVADGEIGADMGSLPPDQKRMSLVEFLIDNQLFAEAGEASKLGEGKEFEDRLAYLKRRALRELYFEKIIKGSVSDADARKIYDDQVKMLKPEEEVSARHILVESEDKIKEIKEKVKGGGDFVALAKEFSKDPGSKDNGGDLGYFGKGQMVPEFEQVVFTLKKGDVSDPVKTQFGWHLIKIEDRRTKQPPAFDIVKDRILQSLLLQKAQQSATELRSKAKIEFVDEGIKKAIDDRNKTMQQQTAPGGAPSAAPAPAPAGDAPKPEEKK